MKKIDILLELLELKTTLMHDLYTHVDDVKEYEFTLNLYKKTQTSIEALIKYFKENCD